MQLSSAARLAGLRLDDARHLQAAARRSCCGHRLAEQPRPVARGPRGDGTVHRTGGGVWGGVGAMAVMAVMAVRVMGVMVVMR